MIEVHDLVKWYGPTLAVDHVSFAIESGKIVGFLGPNGAGKSTTLRILTGYLPPTSGRAVIAGQDAFTAPEAARARIGYLPESTPLYPEMRVEEYLHYRGKLFNLDRNTRLKRIDHVCERCGLAQVRRRVIGRLSRGNRQRVGIAQALLHNPPVLILDEPTAGLDPNQIQQFRNLLNELRGQHTILLSTHILPEAEKVADEVLVIASGRIVASGTPLQLRQRVEGNSDVLLQVRTNGMAVKRIIEQLPNVAAVQVQEKDGWSHLQVTAKNNTDLRESLGQAVAANGWTVRELRHQVASLEQFFVQITAEQSRSTRESAA